MKNEPLEGNLHYGTEDREFLDRNPIQPDLLPEKLNLWRWKLNQKAIRQGLEAGLTAVYDADLKGYSIPHDKLLACVKMRVADRSVLRLIRMWLEAPIVEEKDGKNLPPRSNDQGTPQGGVVSPLLANIYLHWFDQKFHRKDGPANWAKARLTRYADDFVIQARYQGSRLKQWIEGELEGWLGWVINREKTRTIQLRDEAATLDFLGYSFR
jgi:RNA-directed DNA polymerase